MAESKLNVIDYFEKFELSDILSVEHFYFFCIEEDMGSCWMMIRNKNNIQPFFFSY